MDQEVNIDRSVGKKAAYAAILPQLESLIAGEPNRVANLANIAAVLKSNFNFWWIGFYIMEDDDLVLGPFQGPMACTRIALGKGVCGTAAKEKRSILVPDVDLFPGHIACSAASKSELVVPVLKEGNVSMIIDADSTVKAGFDHQDLAFFESLALIISHL